MFNFEKKIDPVVFEKKDVNGRSKTDEHERQNVAKGQLSYLDYPITEWRFKYGWIALKFTDRSLKFVYNQDISITEKLLLYFFLCSFRNKTFKMLVKFDPRKLFILKKTPHLI